MIKLALTQILHHLQTTGNKEHQHKGSSHCGDDLRVRRHGLGHSASIWLVLLFTRGLSHLLQCRMVRAIVQRHQLQRDYIHNHVFNTHSHHCRCQYKTSPNCIYELLISFFSRVKLLNNIYSVY